MKRRIKLLIVLAPLFFVLDMYPQEFEDKLCLDFKEFEICLNHVVEDVLNEEVEVMCENNRGLFIVQLSFSMDSSNIGLENVRLFERDSCYQYNSETIENLIKKRLEYTLSSDTNINKRQFQFNYLSEYKNGSFSKEKH